MLTVSKVNVEKMGKMFPLGYDLSLRWRRQLHGWGRAGVLLVG